MLEKKVEENILKLINRFGEIPGERRILLDQFAESISEQLNEDKKVKLTFICTHNSRRSHMSQIWAQTAAEYFGVDDISCFSGGTEVTAFNLSAVCAVEKYGSPLGKPPSAHRPCCSGRSSPRRRR